ncbi:MFS transporter [Rheinheimera hassiensis]|uniref:MFS transporter n=1 Tax=Rheinheimera hassiensis TaxID=1193627 RepID=UPI001F068FF2|nr:MFS transporter [Rheinheimera hassiensis]
MTVAVTDMPRDNAQPAYWSGVFAMTLCVFALIASEFLPVSLLTPLAADLSVTEGMAGQGIAISGAFAVLTSLFIPLLAGNLDRKTLLLVLTALMGASGAIVAMAPGYGIYMLGRALLGVVIGGFWSMSAATAIRLVPSEKVPRALAIFNSGNALAAVIAVPLGAYLGAVIGWRGAFLCLVPVAAIAFVWQWLSLPAMPVASAVRGPANVFRLLKQPLHLLGMLAVGIFFMGQFALFTFIRPFLETVTAVTVPTLSAMFFVLGIAGLIGTAFIGGLLQRNLYRMLIVMPLLMAVTALALIAFGSSVAAVFVLLGFWGLVATAAPVGWWAWLAKSVPQNAEAGGGLMVAVIQLAIAVGSTLGGVLFDAGGYQIAFVASALLLLLAAVLTALTARRAVTLQ